MTFKRISSAALALTMAASLTPATLAVEEITPISANVEGGLLIAPAPASEEKPEGWTPADGARLPEKVQLPADKAYQTPLYLNGEQLDAGHIPAIEGSMLPMRLLTEADGGVAEWYQDDNEGFFYLGDSRISVHFEDNSVELDFQKVEGVSAIVTDGVTFLPTEFVNGLPGITVEQGDNGIEVATPNGQPLTKLTKSIIEELEMACSMKTTADEMQEYLKIDVENFDQLIGFSPMMINADTIFIGHYAEKADKKAAKEQFQGQLETVQKSFEHYLPGPYAMAMEGQVVESEDGEWLMLIISADNEKAIEMWQAGLAEMAEAAE